MNAEIGKLASYHAKKTCLFCWPQTVCCCKGYDFVLFSFKCA